MAGAGEYRHIVTLWQPYTVTDTTTGEDVTTYVPVQDIHAVVEPLTAKEIERARQIQSDTTHRITIRYRKDICSTWQLSFTDPRGTHTLNISGIRDPDQFQRRKELQVDATEVAHG